MPHTYTSTPPRGREARLFYWGANLPNSTADVAEIEPGPHDHETNKGSLCYCTDFAILNFTYTIPEELFQFAFREIRGTPCSRGLIFYLTVHLSKSMTLSYITYAFDICSSRHSLLAFIALIML